MNKSHARWIPAIAVPAVVVAGAIAVPQIANADVKLPSKSPSAIVALARSSAGTSFQGTVSETANLGLPDISASSLGGGSQGSSAADALSQLTGTHQAKVFVSGTTAARVQTLDNLKERDVIRNGSNLWTYDSSTNKAVHVTLPSGTPRHATPQTDTGQTSTPSDVASQVLSDISQYSTISTSDNVRVAGRTAYGLTVTPKTSDTLVGSVTLDIDSATGVPLRATVLAKGQSKPAFEVGFTKIDFSNPSASTFQFTPPKGAQVKTIQAPKAPATSGGVHAGAQTPAGEASTAQKRAAAEAKYQAALAKYQPTVIGSGWSTIIGAKLPDGATGALGSSSGAQSSQLLDQVFTNVSGGRVLQTSLVSVFLANDGKLYVGAVSASSLEAAVASQK